MRSLKITEFPFKETFSIISTSSLNSQYVDDADNLSFYEITSNYKGKSKPIAVTTYVDPKGLITF